MNMYAQTLGRTHANEKTDKRARTDGSRNKQSINGRTNVDGRMTAPT